MRLYLWRGASVCDVRNDISIVTIKIDCILENSSENYLEIIT